jgi:site-specific DNA recombinase
MRVAAYERISEDPNDLRTGVTRQREDCEKVAAQRGWTVVEHYTDNDVSAYKRKVVRPQFERMLADLAAGTLDGFVAYDLDRAWRQPKDLERAIELFETRPGLVCATVQGDVNLGTSDGLLMARMLVAQANKNSHDTARRVARAHLANAMTGVPVGGTRPFGWLADKRTIDPVEATLIRDAAAKILGGATLTSVVREWQAGGVLTPRGNLWLRGPLRLTLRSPRLAGYRVHQKTLLRDADGVPVQGLWEPILDVPSWERLAAVLASVPGSRPGGVARYLLSGLVRCGECGAKLRGNADRRWSTHMYSCAPPTHGGCGKVGVTGPLVDGMIVAAYFKRVQDRRVAVQEVGWDGDEQMTAAQGRIADLMAAFNKGELSGDVVFPSVQLQEKILARLRADRDAWLRMQATLPTADEDVIEMWDSYTIEKQRATLGRSLVAVAIRRSVVRGRKFDPDRVGEPVWREP